MGLSYFGQYPTMCLRDNCSLQIIGIHRIDSQSAMTLVFHTTRSELLYVVC